MVSFHEFLIRVLLLILAGPSHSQSSNIKYALPDTVRFQYKRKISRQLPQRRIVLASAPEDPPFALYFFGRRCESHSGKDSFRFLHECKKKKEVGRD